MLNHAEILRISTLLEGQILSASVRDLLGELLLSPSVVEEVKSMHCSFFFQQYDARKDAGLMM